jgi:tetratricopeptide (TPR) repeat protein
MTQVHDPRLRLSKAIGALLAIAAFPAALPLAGCDTAAFAAGTSIQVIRRASPAVGRFRDPELAEAAVPSSIGTMEGLLEIKPDDVTLRVLLARSYASYGYAFLEDRMEDAEFRGADEEEIERWRTRASLAYQRARELAVDAMDLIRPEGGGVAGAQRRGLEAFIEHLRRFDNREEHVPPMFWAAYAWARWISLNRESVAALADLPFVNALAERVHELDPSYYDYAPVALRAGLMGTAPEQLGGRPREALEHFQRVMEATGRRNLMYLVTTARICAIPLQDRALYQRLLQEVLDADVDADPEQRLANILAQRRARRYLAQIDEFFDSAVESDENSAATAPAD